MNTNIQPGSPRQAGEVSPKTKVEAKTLFESVEKGVAHERRTDKADAWKAIDNLKDNRNFFEKWMAGPFVQDIVALDLKEKFKAVRAEFAKYKSVGIEIPKTILEKFVSKGGALLDTPAYIDSEEAERLKDLAYEGEQGLKFNEQLNDRPGLHIDGNLEDMFKDKEGKVKEPSRKVLLDYCDSLKKLFEKKEYFPDSVTSNPEPNVFVFHFKGEEPTTVTVTSTKDLKELQENLSRCSNEDKVVDIFVGDVELRPIDILKAKDPFAVKEGDAKRDIMAKLGQLNVDPRGTLTRWWDNIVGLFTKSTNVLGLEKTNQDLIQTIQSEFDKVVGNDTRVGDIVLKNKNFDEAVLSKQSEEVKAKLTQGPHFGERLTADEVKQLQSDTFKAMKQQRYLDDLRSNPIPTEFELGHDLLRKEMPDEIVFDKYLHKLKEELIKGNYPGIITSDPDVHKFIFFKTNGEYEEFTVESFEDLITLEKRLKACVIKAQEERGRLGLYFTPEQLATKLAASETLQKRQQAELEAARAGQEQLKAAAQKAADEKDKAIAEREELAKKIVANANELQAALGQDGELRKAKKVAEERADAAEKSAAEVKASALLRESEAISKANQAEEKFEKLRIETSTMAERFERLDANQKAVEEAATEIKKASDQKFAQQIAELNKKVEVATAAKVELEAQQQDIATKLASTKEVADQTKLEKENLEKIAQLDAAEKAELTQKANVAQAEIERLKAETLLHTSQIANLQSAQRTLERQHDKATEELRVETGQLKTKINKLEADIKKQFIAQKSEIMGEVGEKLEITKEQTEKEVILRLQVEKLQKQKVELEKKLIENRKLADNALVAEYLIGQFQNLYPIQGHRYANQLLVIAVISNNIEVLNELLAMENYQINFNTQDYYGTTPLQLAVGEKQIDVVKLLLRRRDIDVDLPDLFGNAALHFAVSDYPNEDIFDALLGIENIKVNLVNKKGETPLHIAARSGSPHMAEQLIIKGADVNIVDAKGNTALHYAVEYIDMMNELFLANDINLNIKNLEGFTPLHLAVIRGDFDIVDALINKGANLDIRDEQNKRALDLASEELAKHTEDTEEGTEARKIYDLLKEKTPKTVGETLADMADIPL